MLCDSIKVKDPMKVGRFGLGFKSVFHVTGEITIFYFFPSLRAGGILQILQSDWFRERALFYDLAR